MKRFGALYPTPWVIQLLVSSPGIEEPLDDDQKNGQDEENRKDFHDGCKGGSRLNGVGRSLGGAVSSNHRSDDRNCDQCDQHNHDNQGYDFSSKVVCGCHLNHLKFTAGCS